MQTFESLESIDPTLRVMLAPDAIVARENGSSGVLATALHTLNQPGAMRGWSRSATLRPGFSLVVADASCDEAASRKFVAGDHIKFHCKLEGRSVIKADGADTAISECGRVSYLVQPPETAKYEEFSANTRMRSVTMICSRDFVSEFIADRGSLPIELVGFLKGPVATFAHRGAPLPPSMRAIAEELLVLRSDRLAELMLEAKALELLCLILQELSSSAGFDVVKPRTRQKVQALCELLETEDGMAMSIAQLSRILAWNDTQMMEGFRQVTDTTISAYRQRLRLNRALDDLRSTDRSITEIAFDAGYEHPSNFTTAFRREFGITPRMSRSRLS